MKHLSKVDPQIDEVIRHELGRQVRLAEWALIEADVAAML